MRRLPRSPRSGRATPEEFGPTSIAMFLGSGNTGTLGGGAPEGSVMARLLNVMGASRVLPDRDIATPMSWAYVFGAGPYGNRSIGRY